MNLFVSSIILSLISNPFPTYLLFAQIEGKGFKYFINVIIQLIFFCLLDLRVPFRLILVRCRRAMNFLWLFRNLILYHSRSSLRWDFWVFSIRFNAVQGHWGRGRWFLIIYPYYIQFSARGFTFHLDGFLLFCFFVNLWHLIQNMDHWLEQNLLLT